MSKMNRFKAALLKALAEFANVTTDKGILAWDGDEDLKVGDAVYIEDAEGNRTPAEDGDYKTDDNKTIVVVGGEVAEINDPEIDIEPTTEEETEPVAEEAEEQTLASVATDKGDLLYDGTLEVGTEVFVTDEEGNQVAAPDGEYILENGDVLKVAEGKVAEIAETADSAETEETPAEDEALVALKAENESLKAEVAELKSQIEALKATPMAYAAHEEVTTSQKMEKTGDKVLDKLARLLSK
jgi:hypothetical protein